MDLAVGEDGAVVAFEDVLDGLCCTMTVDVGLVAAAICAWSLPQNASSYEHCMAIV